MVSMGSFNVKSVAKKVGKAARRARRIKNLEKQRLKGSMPLAALSNASVKKLYKVYKRLK